MPTRLSVGALLAGIGGTVLIVSLFLPWYSFSGYYSSGSDNGWESSKFVDIVLLVLGGLAIAFAVLELRRMQVRLPFGRARTLQVIGIVATTITLSAIVEGSSQGFGLFLAALSAIAILVGGVFAERAPDRTVALGGGGGRAAGPAWSPGGGGAQPAAPPPAAGPPIAGGETDATAPHAHPADPPPAGTAAANWYPDPRGEKRLRYWDGSQWTQHVAD